MRKIALLLCLLGLSLPVSAAPPGRLKRLLRPALHPVSFFKRNKLLVISSAIYLAADFTDTQETIEAQRRCPTCVETSDLYGPHPSPAHLWGESAAFDAGYIAFDWYGNREDSLMGTRVGWTAQDKEEHPTLYRLCWMERPVTMLMMGAASFAHAHAAYVNAQIPYSPGVRH